ncbi:MAG: bifunctional phosphoribosylaminoimidazolecarboxamide formyltransferase/IMP cyclohydrolase [Bacillota bacterium]
MGQVRKALISVYDKTGVVDFCRELLHLGYQLISTGGTYKLLVDHGIEVVKVSEITNFPEILGGRVKTLHPRIHGGILAKRTSEHRRELEYHNIGLIDLVVVNLYPFEETIKKPGVDIDEILENIDIGGPTMVRAAAKNFPNVTVVVKPERYSQVIEALKEGSISLEFRRELAVEAFAHTANYDACITGYLGNTSGCSEQGDSKLSELTITGVEGIPLRYGENPHQKAQIYKVSGKGRGLAHIIPLQGKQLSYNNYLDTYAAWKLVQEFSEPAAVIVKHNNPCGAAVGTDLLDAYFKALECDPVSAFGGIVAFNNEVTAPLAAAMAKTFFEVIAAPKFSKESLEIFKTKPNLRILPIDSVLDDTYEIRSIGSSLLVQETDKRVQQYPLKIVTGKEPRPEQINDLLFAFRIVKWVKSNAIVIAKDGRTLGIGAGQMNRVGAAKAALEQAGEKGRGGVLASDAFLPFADTVELAAKYGISAIIQPGGSVKDEEVIQKCNELGIAMVFTGIRHFKH